MRVALVPGVLAFLPEYAGLEDPVAEVRAASTVAAAWVADAGAVTVVAGDQGGRVGRHLLEVVGGHAGEGGYLVVANGTARRNDTAPGYVDERAIPFDDAVLAALSAPDPAFVSLATFDPSDQVGSNNWPEQPLHVTGNSITSRASDARGSVHASPRAMTSSAESTS